MKESDMTPKRRRGIYLLPNLFTTTALFAGFYSMVAAINNDFATAAISVLVAMIMDGLDGRVARMTNTQTEFGAEYDSLADIVSFGVAPALIVYLWSLSDLASYGWRWGKMGWVAAFFYAACTALRLARFNVAHATADRRFFQGLACPSAAAIMVCMVWVLDDSGYDGRQLSIIALVVTITTALLMVSRFAYYSFKDFGQRDKVPFFVILAIVLLYAFASIDPPRVIFAIVVFYGLSGPVFSTYRWIGKRLRRGKAA